MFSKKVNSLIVRYQLPFLNILFAMMAQVTTDLMYEGFCPLFPNKLHALITDIIQDPFFRRLDNFSQLGTAKFTPSNGDITRGAHSIDARRMAETYISFLNINPAKENHITEKQFLAGQAAAHHQDVGRSPYSHSFQVANSDSTNNGSTRFNHSEQ